ncbi:MAG: 50S ribosomal protein L9 [Buchnera aphidicola (Meitanaphis elongallis)]
MQVILLTKVENLGNLGDIVRAKPGYVRNFLVPFGKAMVATKINIALVLKKKEKLEQKILEKLSLAKLRAEKVKMVTQPVVIFSKSRKEGKLFGSVGSRDIAELLSSLSGVEIKKREIFLLNGVFRKIGEYNIVFKPHHDVAVTIMINIVSKEET